MKRKNGFTLIELLAVIVILAIIALIATPIMLGIVEDAKRDAFLRSVELVVSSTDIDVMSKLTDSGHTYELMEGKISDRKEVYYTVGDNCETIISEIGFHPENVSTICNNEPYFDGLTLTEVVAQNLSDPFVLSLIDAGVVQIKYNDNNLNLAKNTAGMNGSIIYDKKGKEIYAIHNEKYCVVKKLNMTKAKISNYVKGECNSDITFQEFMALNPQIGDKTTSGEGQLINLGEYGIRYQGKEPNNYIYFNCSDYSNQTIDTCELWRIIGVVDGNVKLIRSESIGEYAWDEETCDENGNNCVYDFYDNNWSNASLQTYLNGEYYTSMINKNAETGNSNQASTWYLRGHDTNVVTKDVMYHLERTTGSLYGSNPEKIENTNIGLMYSSDYGYAAMENEICLATTTLNGYSFCKASNWIAQGLSLELRDSEWLITPYSGFSDHAFCVDSNGAVYDNYHGATVLHRYGVRPVLNLISGVRLSDGLGTKENPYILSME